MEEEPRPRSMWLPPGRIQFFLGFQPIKESLWCKLNISQDEFIISPLSDDLLLGIHERPHPQLQRPRCHRRRILASKELEATLLNHILTSQHAKGIAVNSSLAEDIVMVNTGCLCCTVHRGGGSCKDAFEDKFDHIFIEKQVLSGMKVVRASKEPGGSAGHPCRSNRAEADTGQYEQHCSRSPSRGMLLQSHGAAPQLIQ